MKPNKIVRLSNIVGITSIMLLVYWVFIFICIQVFGLKIFRQNLTETFYMSVFAILALMFGSLMLNIMFNLTRIAQKHNTDAEENKAAGSNKSGWIMVLSFPVIFALLYGGNYLTEQKKERLLIQSAKAVIESDPEKTDHMVAYSFDWKWIEESQNTLDLLCKSDKNFPDVSVIVRDTVEHSKVLLRFAENYRFVADTIPPVKRNYLLPTDQSDRNYLNSVFDKGNNNIKFNASDGHYTLYYPCTKNGKTVVLFFSDYQRYGKIGS